MEQEKDTINFYSMPILLLMCDCVQKVWIRGYAVSKATAWERDEVVILCFQLALLSNTYWYHRLCVGLWIFVPKLREHFKQLNQVENSITWHFWIPFDLAQPQSFFISSLKKDCLWLISAKALQNIFRMD